MLNRQHCFYGIGFLSIGLILYGLHSIFTPLLCAALLAYLVNPLVSKLTSHHVPRIISILFVFLIFVFLILVIFLLVLPIIERQLITLMQTLPLIKKGLKEGVLPWLAHYFPSAQAIDFNTLFQEWETGNKVALKIGRWLSTSTKTVVQLMFDIVITFVLTFYFLKDWRRIISFIQQSLCQYIPARVFPMFEECGATLASFLRGQLLVTFTLSFFYAIGLWMTHLKVGFLIGLLTGLLSLIPYLGITFGISFSIIASLIQYHTISHLLAILTVFVIGQFTESFILTPNLIGQRIGLHPVVILLALFSGGKLFGLMGVLLAIPTTAVLVIIARYFPILIQQEAKR